MRDRIISRRILALAAVLLAMLPSCTGNPNGTGVLDAFQQSLEIAGDGQVVRSGETAVLSVILPGQLESNAAVKQSVSYLWIQVSGPIVLMDDPSGASISFVAPTIQESVELGFQVTAVFQGVESFGHAVITVVPFDGAAGPTAQAAAQKEALAGDSVTLDGSASTTAGGETLEYNWVQTGGPTVDLLDPTSTIATFLAPEFAEDTVLTFALTVGDGVSTSSTTVSVTVLGSGLVGPGNPDNINTASAGPVADAGTDLDANVGDLVALDGSASTGDGSQSYLWTQLAGSSVALSALDQSVVTFVAPSISGNTETLAFELVVSQGDLLSSAIVQVTIHGAPAAPSGGGGAPPPPPVNQPPLVDAGLDQAIVLPINSVQLTASVSDDGLPASPGVVSVTWSVQSGPGNVTFANANSANTTATFQAPGTYVLNLDASDGELSASDTVTVHVLPILTIVASPASGPAPLTVQLTAEENGGPPTNLPQGSGIQDLEWRLDDGTVIGNGVQVSSYTFNTSGTHTVVLWLTVVGSLGQIECQRANIVASAVAGSPGVLAVAPTQNFSISGPEGGPLVPASELYTLSNTGGSDLNWSVSGNPSWLDVTPSSSGTLAAAGSVGITVSINSSANTLAPGLYTGTMSFTNTTDGNGDTTRDVALTVLSTSVPSNIVAPFSNQAVTVDGTIAVGEWDDAQTYSMDGTDTLFPGIVVAGAQAATAADSNATIYVKHDATYLYVAVVVQDDNIIQSAGNVWQADVVELFMDLDNSNSTNVGFNRFQLLVNAGGATGEGGAVPGGSWTGAGSTSGNSYVAEFRIDKAVTGLVDGQTYGFDLAISDVEPTTGTIATRYWYFSTVAAEGDESQWGDIVLQASGQGVLAVTPGDGLNGSGNVGGPFNPPSKTYTLTNNGGSAINWTAAKTQPWATLSKTGGTLTAGATDTVIVSFNSGANSLAANSYADTVTFANTTNASGNTTRAVGLTVNAAVGVLAVSPADGLNSGGLEGGPFAPSSKNYTLTNTGTASLNWTAAKTQAWAALSKSSGTLATGATDTVTVSLNAGANSLVAGSYGDTVAFTNTTNGNGNTTRPVVLTVSPAGGGGGLPMLTASRTSGVAPLAVFFDAVDAASGVVQPADGDYAALYYKWDFGDPLSGFWSTNNKSKNAATGYVAAHVFENPGTYTIRLTVTQPGGQTVDYQQAITVSAFSGNTYYVRADGNDGNTGTGSSVGEAWRTCGKAFSAVTGNSIVQPGDRVLFRRGDVFTYSLKNRISKAHDIIIGAFPDDDTLPPPLYQYTGSTSNVNSGLFLFGDNQRITVKDININANSGSAYGNGFLIASFLNSGSTEDILLLRFSITGFTENIGGIGGEGLRQIFIVDSNITNSNLHQGHMLGVNIDEKFAILGTIVDRGSTGQGDWSMGMYLHRLVKSVISDNYVARPNPTSPTIRLYGSPGSSAYVVVRQNIFNAVGSIPGTQSYANFELIQSGGSSKLVHDILIENNEIINGRMLLTVREGFANITIRRNLFVTPSDGGWASIEPPRAGDQAEGPVRNLAIYNNVVVSAGIDLNRPMLGITADNVENIRIFNNIFNPIAGAVSSHLLDIANQSLLGELYFDHNIYYFPGVDTSSSVRIGGMPNSPISLSQWLASNETHSLTIDPRFENGTYLLQNDSPAIDAGIMPSIMYMSDLWDDPNRTPWPNVSGANVIDIGAHEYVP